MINCPYCGKLTDPKLSSCPHCGGPMQAQAPRQKTRAAQAQQCPRCGAQVQEGDIICVRCGTNLLTGQKIAEEQKVAVARRQFNWLPLLVGLAVVIVLLVLGLAWLYLAGGDPVARAVEIGNKGNPLEAINLLREHVADRPDDARAHLALGKLLWKTEQHAGAADMLEAAARLNPEDDEAALMAVAALRRQTGRESASRQGGILQRHVQSHPDDARAWMLLALALGATNDLEGQIDALERVIELEPGNAQARQYLGMAQALEGDAAGARASLESAASAGVSGGDFAAAQGALALLDGDAAGAEIHLQQALQSGASVRPMVQAQLGMLYLRRGDYGAALPLLEQASKGPNAAAAIAFAHGLCLEALGRESEAVAAYERLVEAGGEMAGAAAAQLAAIYLGTDNTARARDVITKGEQAQGPAAKLATLQGRLALLEGDELQAQESFRRAMNADPAYPAAHLENGLLYIRRGALAEGLGELQRYLELSEGAGQAVRSNEIKLLVSQLKQTLDGGSVQ